LDADMVGYAVNTPAFICDAFVLVSLCEAVETLCRAAKIGQFFHLSMSQHIQLSAIIAELVDGIATSSMFDPAYKRSSWGWEEGTICKP